MNGRNALADCAAGKQAMFSHRGLADLLALYFSLCAVCLRLTTFQRLPHF
jgi:hypothetical protein